jgi:hypothetical protein
MAKLYPEKQTWFCLEASEADIAQQVSFLPHLDVGQTHALPPKGVQASPGEKHEGRAAAVSGANSWSMECMQQAAIFQQQHKQKTPEAPEEGREAQ